MHRVVHASCMALCVVHNSCAWSTFPVCGSRFLVWFTLSCVVHASFAGGNVRVWSMHVRRGPPPQDGSRSKRHTFLNTSATRLETPSNPLILIYYRCTGHILGIWVTTHTPLIIPYCGMSVNQHSWMIGYGYTRSREISK